MACRRPILPLVKAEKKRDREDVSLDHGKCVLLCDYIDKLTHSGKTSLDADLMKKLKGICKLSDAYVKYAYGLLIDQLEKNHAEIRLSAFQISAELFTKSHAFRELILGEFQDFMELTIECNPELPLPPPKAAAQMLRKTAIEAIHKWNEKYSADYKKIGLAYHYLKNCKKYDFNGAEVRTQSEQRRIEERNRQSDLMKKQRRESVLKEMSDSHLEIKDILLQTENCIKLLLPEPESFQIHGLMSPEHRSDQNPFKIYTQRTPSSPKVDCRKTTDLSKVKNRQTSKETTNLKSSESLIQPDTLIKQAPSSPEILDSKAKIITDKGKKELPIASEGVSEINATHSKHLEKNTITPLEKEIKLETIETSQAQCIESEIDDEEDFQEISSTSSSDSESEFAEEDVVRSFGLGNHQYRMRIEINAEDFTIEETDDNIDLTHALKDASNQIKSKFLPKVQRWLEVLSKTEAPESDVRKAIDMKTALKTALDRATKLRVKRPISKRTVVKEETGDDDKEDSDFEDVPEKEGFEADVPEHLKENSDTKPKNPPVPTSRDWQLIVPNFPSRKETQELDPTTSDATILRLLGTKQTASSGDVKEMSSVKKLPVKKEPKTYPEAPVVPFSTDLMHWGEENPEKPLIVRYESSHRFWNAAFEDTDIVDKVAVEAMNTRTINFTGKFEPVKWACRAPLSNGKLCPRKDRIKCPFHGKIVPRDNIGQPTNPEDIEHIKKEEEKKNQGQPAEWEDPELQAEIQAATGIDLNPGGAPTKGKRRSKRKHPGLTNINKPADTSKRRLEKKILSPKAMRRVEEKMAGLSNKRTRDKFGNNFNYALN